ncbi:MAG: NADH-quinone oxidoreductase subunit N [Candidatus Thorarchaeota archaeon]
MMLQLDLLADFIRSMFAPLSDAITALIPAEQLNDYLMSLPAITLVVFAVIALVVGLRYNPLPVSFIGVILATVEMVLFEPSVLGGSSFGGLYVRDAFGDFFIYIILMVAILVLMSTTLYGGNKGPYNFLLMVSFAGAIWVVMATDLVGLFMAWELMSTPTYMLVALSPHREGIDGATKYFVMGLLSTALMLLGIALVYGVTGTTMLSEVGTQVAVIWASPYGVENAAYTLLLAMVLFIVAFGFKVGIFPGWQWVPDAYASADGSVTGYLAGGSKKTGVSALIRIMMVAFLVAKTEWMPLIIAVAILTMVIGNVLALAQKDIMRMLAYSSIAMMGYLFIGLAVGTEYGAAAAIFHAFTHALTKTAAFILIWAMSVRLAKRIKYDDLAGLSKRSPLAALTLTVFVLSLAGMPLTVGFYSKILLFHSAAVAGLWWLALIGIINSVFSLGYYLRILKYSYFMEPKEEGKLVLARIPMAAVVLCFVAVVGLFLYADLILPYAFEAAHALLS